MVMALINYICQRKNYYFYRVLQNFHRNFACSSGFTIVLAKQNPNIFWYDNLNLLDALWSAADIFHLFASKVVEWLLQFLVGFQLIQNKRFYYY